MKRDGIHASKVIPCDRPVIILRYERDIAVAIRSLSDGSAHPVEEKRVAGALARRGGDDWYRNLASGSRRHQCARPAVTEGRQPSVAAVAGPHHAQASFLGRGRPRSKGGDHRERHARDPSADEHEQIERVRVGPVAVVEEEQRRTIQCLEPTNNLVDAGNPIG